MISLLIENNRLAASGGEEFGGSADFPPKWGETPRFAAIFEEKAMRLARSAQLEIGAVPIENIHTGAKSRDDIPAILLGLRHLCASKALRRRRVFELLEAEVTPAARKDAGRPGMDLWRILALGVLKQGLGCDFDRLAHMANHDGLVRRMPGHSPALGHACEQQAAVDNVSLSGPKLLSGIGRLVAGSGREAAGKKPGEPLRGRAGSFCVETDAHYPTDADLLRDAMRCAVRTAARLADSAGLGGWRQHEHLSRQVKKRFDRVRVSRRSRKHPGRVERHLSLSARLAGRAEATLALACELEGYLGHARRQLEQARRRLLGGETIAHGEKVFSIFEPHTRWVAEGKAGVRQELGVPVAVVEGAMERFADLRACSFDRGFHSPANQAELGARLDECALPAKGRPNAEAAAREGREWFQAARRQHPAVESAINHLEHCGLGRVRAHGERGFERAAALAALAANPERLGRLLRDQERKRLARRARLRAA